MSAEIITIGDEILIGQIVDTNSAWMAQKLNEIGLQVKQISSISDNRVHILETLKAASERADIILITGGLGPTKDDITKKTLAEYFGTGFRRDEQALENVLQIFKNRGPVLEMNLEQADVPANCSVLQNKNGTAPGMWFEQDGKVYVSMPGVPFEMMYMMEEEVLPRLQQRFNFTAIVHHTLLTAGIGESFLAKLIEPAEEALPPHIRLAYLPKPGQVRLRLSAYGENETLLKAQVETAAKHIMELVGEYVIAVEDKPLEKVVLDFMEQRQLTLTTAESCTGGYIAHLLTQHAGSSAVFLGAAVSYSNQLKQDMLGVNPAVIEQFGAVSEETVREMAAGALKAFHSDYAVSVSGIAGPGGGTPEKPVGTVWVAAAGPKKTITRKFQFGNKRLQNIERSAVSALLLLLKLLQEEHA